MNMYNSRYIEELQLKLLDWISFAFLLACVFFDPLFDCGMKANLLRVVLVLDWKQTCKIKRH